MTEKTYASEMDFINGMLMRPIDLEIDGVGLVQVRGLSSLEVREVRAKHSGDSIGVMLATIEIGMVTPKLSEDGVKALHNGHPGKADEISSRIMELSGLGGKKQDPLAGNG